MAPTVQTVAETSLQTLQNVLKRRIDTNRVLKEKEKGLLNGEGYRVLEASLNNKQFLQPIDSENTKASLYYIRQKFIRYCAHRIAGSWRIAILEENCNKGRMMAFLRWICEDQLAKRRKGGKRKTVNQYWREFKMLYRRVNGHAVDANDSLEVVKYINGELKIDFDLDTTLKAKPVAGPDDLLLLLVHHWARDTSVLPTEDDRLDIPTIMLFQSYTGGRPAEFVHSSKGKASLDPLGHMEDKANEEHFEDESDDGIDSEHNYKSDSDANRIAAPDRNSGYNSNATRTAIREDVDKRDDIRTGNLERLEHHFSNNEFDKFGEVKRKYKALCYEDICLWIVQNPNTEKRDVLIMEVTLRHHKGVDNKPKPTTFLFRENPLPILCPISHILSRAIRDDAILVNGYTSAEPFFSTNLRAERTRAMKVHWKPEWLKRPLFRRAIRVMNGFEKSKTEPMSYSTYAFYIDRLGRDAGLEDKLTSYCFRRGTANAVNGAASDAVRDQVLRHDPHTGVFSGAYRDELVRFNVQDAFLENDISDDGLTRAFTHMSIRCNPGAPTEVPIEVMKQLFAAEPDIVNLERRLAELRTNIKWKYRFIKNAPKKIKTQYEDLQKQLTNMKKSLENEIEDAYRKDYFFQIHNEMMKKQLKRQTTTTVLDEAELPESLIQHQLLERNRLQQILCDFCTDIGQEGIVQRKISAIDLMVALASRRELQTRSRKPRAFAISRAPIKEESPVPAITPFMELDDFPLICARTQCIYCIGDERLTSEERKRTFHRVSHMWDHVENVHLSKLSAKQLVVCNHPVCKDKGLVLDHVMHFKNHVAKVHKINLRP